MNVAPADVPRFVLTVTLAVPALTIRLAGTDTTIASSLSTVAGGSATPFQYTAAPATKFVPMTASVKAVPPTSAELGLRLAIVGGPEMT